MKEIQGGITAPEGFLAGGLHCGIKKNKEPDLAIIYSTKPAIAVGMYTKNFVKAAPVLYSQKALQGGTARAIVVNSGNANAVTGEQGKRDTEAMARTTAMCLGVSPYEVAVASTGVIGQFLPIDKVTAGIRKLAPSLKRDGGEDAAAAIMTTDTVPKSVAVRVQLSRGSITVGGIAKGAGMICPDLATLLVFITTDANIDVGLLSHALDVAVEASFNALTIDGDTSTNDTVLALANGAADASSITGLTADYYAFETALKHVCARLAEMIARDGEGATKLARVNVLGALTKADADRIAKTIANSLLVKTAIFGNDANWGRVIAAAGRAGVEIDPGLIDIDIGGLPLLKHGVPQSFDEKQAKEILSQKEVAITIELHLGPESATVLTCDLSYDYVKINAAYRT
ncbi:MAG: bifunctional glutamate N-acetyltransferase/amino-acid acetyltransferase ArgJ [Candidatus Abyssobacteria bacterium SURF_17]|uniref:Arginine biosynthesis bifunctional protein ArgJ n=1 Tax=Candidatus Abyssobacteria bacterium SURF_17 TaxID=2093361 RepID=A0A419EW03_9BACT|nr:MAG: bifunctional glutamate N-acetyltransferase/amino-acid acetyltransferase ArgJ [Candidatus Abyssubacteria bacterium SURF_17]